MSMIVEYGAILKVDFRRLGLSQRKSEFFNRIGREVVAQFSGVADTIRPVADAQRMKGTSPSRGSEYETARQRRAKMVILKSSI